MSIVQPEIHQNTSPIGGTIETHNSYGQISASRISVGGRGLNLYGSDFSHGAAVTITIRTSELHRSLSRDSYYPKKELISVTLSESQWATFVSSLNNGSGPCCTIEHIQGERMDELPNPKDRITQFASEAKETLEDAIKGIDESIAAIKASGLSEKKIKAILDGMETAKREIVSNLGFVEEQMARAAEKTVEKAKQEINGYMTNVMVRAGLESIANNSILSLGQDGDTTNYLDND